MALGKEVKTYKRKHGAAGEKPRATEAGSNVEDQDTFNEGEISMRVSTPSIPAAYDLVMFGYDNIYPSA